MVPGVEAFTLIILPLPSVQCSLMWPLTAKQLGKIIL